jgi:hypothetical protein
MQAWSRIASSIVAASATCARLAPPARGVEVGQGRRQTAFVPTLATDAGPARVHAVKDTRHAGRRAALPGHRHKLTKKRLSGLTAAAPRAAELHIATIVGAEQVGNLEAQPRRHDCARAPPTPGPALLTRRRKRTEQRRSLLAPVAEFQIPQ